jgi:hypothetical protein
MILKTPKRKIFLEILHREFRNVVIEARKVLERLNKFGLHVEVIG